MALLLFNLVAAAAGEVSVPESYLMPFTAATEAEARAWQDQVRTRLLGLVEAQNPRSDRPLDVEVGGFAQKEGYRQADVTYTSNEGERLEATLTIPDGDGPFPAMVCLHGHGGDRHKVHDAGTEYHGFAAEYARRGFVTIAPSLAHFTYAANQLWNLMRQVDMTEQRPEVDTERIGVAGLSMGGEWSMWLAASDLRLKAAVVSGWMCTTEGVLSKPNCVCWLLPGLLETCDVAEVHILIAPRPVLFESAIEDGCFPVACTRDGYRKIVRGYDVFGVSMKARQHTFPGGHAWNGGIAYGFMEEALGAE
ncbi:MAG TPA: hypothetical protein PLO37_19370 [Candidatus Hydrogenedentes bacterium]|nr:hypothetical protein [Candidatus Hydrogenedentota bacterium]HPG69013.1 hypothetical protein [Candidatus Hydrogenedentota bacterium]